VNRGLGEDRETEAAHRDQQGFSPKCPNTLFIYVGWWRLRKIAFKCC